MLINPLLLHSTRKDGKEEEISQGFRLHDDEVYFVHLLTMSLEATSEKEKKEKRERETVI